MPQATRPLFVKEHDVWDGGVNVASVIYKAVQEQLAGYAVVIIQRDEGGVCRVYVPDHRSRRRLLTTGMVVRGQKVELYENNPITTVGKTEVITVKDLPVEVSNEVVVEYLKSNSYVTIRSSVHRDGARNEDSEQGHPRSYDRTVVVSAGFTPPYPRHVTIRGHKCRIFYRSQEQPRCPRCGLDGHSVLQTESCPAYDTSKEDNVHLIVNHPPDVLSHLCEKEAFKLHGFEFYSIAGAVEWLRVRKLGKDRAAKCLARTNSVMRLVKELKHLSDDQSSMWNEGDKIVAVTRIAREKFKQCPAFREALIRTGDKEIVEASCDRFWGCGVGVGLAGQMDTQYYPGRNVTGRVLEDVRLWAKQNSGYTTLFENAKNVTSTPHPHHVIIGPEHMKPVLEPKHMQPVTERKQLIPVPKTVTNMYTNKSTSLPLASSPYLSNHEASNRSIPPCFDCTSSFTPHTVQTCSDVKKTNTNIITQIPKCNRELKERPPVNTVSSKAQNMRTVDSSSTQRRVVECDYITGILTVLWLLLSLICCLYIQ